MKIASLAEIKRALKERSPGDLLNICLKLGRFKKDNKELLNYLLFEAFDEESFKNAIKEEIEIGFSGLNRSNIYFAKKGIRRILRLVNRQIKYSGLKQTEVELLIFFCQEMKRAEIQFNKSKVLMNMYNRQLQNIHKAIATLDEDLQFDYKFDLEEIDIQL